MAEAGQLSLPAMPAPRTKTSVTALRTVIVVVVLLSWEALAQSGLLYRDVVPSLTAIWAALVKLLSAPDYYWHLSVTAGEVGIGLAAGGLSGLVVGIVLGGNRLLSKAFEPYLYYLGPTPNHMIMTGKKMIFGVGPR